jgi:hypothetical protein
MPRRYAVREVAVTDRERDANIARVRPDCPGLAPVAQYRDHVLKLQASPNVDTVKITFALPLERSVGHVSVVGDFNGWDPFAHPLKKRSNGTRSVSLEVPSGDYRFKYLADDGTWFCDPDVAHQVPNDHGELDSLLRA